MTAELIAFYRARLDEAAQAARTAARHPRWGAWRAEGMQVWDGAGHLVIKHSWPQEIGHIVRNDPATVLADVAAKRSLLDEWGDAEIYAAPSYAALRDVGRAEGLERAVAVLAAAYAGHPDYRAEWRP